MTIIKIMKSKLRDFHHYKGNDLTLFEKVERKVIQLLLTSKLPDSKRESSITFELKHSSSCCQIGKILAQKRNLNVEIAATACVLHDIFVIVEGKYKDHGKLGAPLAENILREIDGFSDDEIFIITNAVAHHSEKEIYSNDPYIELVKDADVFDSSLYTGAEGYYRIHKPEHIFIEYVKRIKRVRDELKLPAEPVFQ